MTPILKPAATPEPAPGPLAPEPVPPPPRARGLIRPAIVVAVAAAIAFGFWPRTRQAHKPVATVATRTVRAVRGALERTLRLAGSITARRFANIAAPRLQAREMSGLDLLYLAPSGTMVKKDEVIAQLDSKAMRDHLDDVEAQVNQTEMDLLKLAAQQAAESEAVRQRARSAKAALEQAQLDAHAIPVRTAIDRELLKLAVEEAQENYDQAQKQVGLYEERHAAQTAVANLNQEGQIHHRDRHRVDIAHCTIKAPISGYAVLNTIYRHHGTEQFQVRVGDELAPGQPFMRVVDLSSMLLDGAVNQSEIDLVRIGQRATVRFDAYPGLVMAGRVEAVGSLAVGSWHMNYYIRQVPVRIALEGSDPRVIPDLSASADVVISQQEDALLVPREAVFEENGKSVVYVKQEGGFAPREVEIGAFSNTQASVVSGLQAGDEVAVQPPGA